MGGRKLLKSETRGVKQGECFDPFPLHNTYAPEHKQCKRRTARCQVGNFRMRPVYPQALAKANDIPLIANNEENFRMQ